MEKTNEKTKKKSVGKRIVAVLGIIIVLAFGTWAFFKYYYVFGEGQKAGRLNHFVYKGYVFKTYEGRLIMAGYNSSSEATTNTIESNKFEFSVSDEEVAAALMNHTGKNVRLHYKEYLNALPWRGRSQFVVDSICWVEETGAPAVGTSEILTE